MISRRTVVNLFRAIELNDSGKVREIMQKNPDLLKFLNIGKRKYTPLWEAMIRGHSEIVEIFMQFGANPNETCSVAQNVIQSEKYNFLHYMASCEFSPSYFKVAEVLLRHGAKVNASVKVRSLFDLFPCVIKSPLRITLEKGNLQIVELFLENGAKLTGPAWGGESPFFYGCCDDYSDCKKMLLLLLKHNLDTSFKNGNGDNLLHTILIECFFDRLVDIAEILLDSGVQLDDQDTDGYTPLHYATQNEDLQMISLFIKRGADVNKKDNEGNTPLFLSNKIEVINLLLKNGADINAKDENGQTPLHFECSFNPNKEIITLFIQSGARISERDDDNHSPIYYLINYATEDDDVEELIDTVLKESAKLNYGSPKNSKDDTDFLWDIKYGHEIYDFFMKELSKMASTNFYSPYSYYDILKMSNLKQLVNLTKNEEFVENFKANLNELRYFKDDLQNIFNKAVEARNNVQVVNTRLSSLFGDFFPSLVIEKIAENLTIEDLPM